MTFNKKIFIFIIFIFLSACGSNSVIQKRAITDPKEQALLKSLAETPEEIETIGALADFYRNRYKSKGEKHDAEKAVGYYTKLLEKQPNWVNANILLYDVYYSLHSSNQEKNFDRLVVQFNKLPEEYYTLLAPPEIAEIYRTIFSFNGNQTKTKELALAAIKRNPQDTNGYNIASNIYVDEKRYISAIALLKQGLKQQPDNILLLNGLGAAYTERAYGNECPFENSSNWKNAIAYFSQSKKLNTENKYTRSELSNAYIAANQTRLGLNEAKKAHALKPSSDTLMSLIEAYSINKKYDESNQLAQQAINTGSEDINAIFYAEIFMRNGEWEKSLDYYKQHNFKDRDDYSIYPIIQSSIIAQLANSSWKANYKLRPKQHSKWQNTLINYWQDTLSNDALLKLAIDRCKKIEAYTYMGYKQYLQKNYSLAKTYLTEAHEQKVPFFVEDQLSFQLLKKIEN